MAGVRTVDSNKLEHGCGANHADVPSFFGFGLEDGHVPTFLPLLRGARGLGK